MRRLERGLGTDWRHASGSRLRRQVHLHNGRVIGDGRRIAHTDVLDVAAPEQDVVVHLVLRGDRVLRLTVLRAERADWKRGEKGLVEFGNESQ